MADRSALLRAVRRAIDEDEPRLVMADWLEDHGESDRAMFIRIQCALARGIPDAAVRRSYQTTERALLARWGWEWARPFGEAIEEWYYQRGFIERVEMQLERSVDALVQLLEHSEVRHVRTLSPFVDFERLILGLPALPHIQGLQFWQMADFDREALRRFLLTPATQQLTSLVLQHPVNSVLIPDDLAVQALFAPQRSRLEELSIQTNGVDRGPSNAVLLALAASPYLRRLKRLYLPCAGHPDLEGPGLQIDVVERLAASPNLAQLEELDLSGTSATWDVWQAILELPPLPRLRKLWLAGTIVRTPGQPPQIGDSLENVDPLRARFDRLAAKIDWSTHLVGPIGRRAGVWHGQEWTSYRQQKFYEIEGWALRRDWDGLERCYRNLCSELAGDYIAQLVDALDFDRFEAQLLASLARAIEYATTHRLRYLVLRLSPASHWMGKFEVYDDYQPPTAAQIAARESGAAPREYASATPRLVVPCPPFDPHSVLFGTHRLDAFRWYWPWNYIHARIVAMLGRSLQQVESRPRCHLDVYDGVIRVL